MMDRLCTLHENILAERRKEMALVQEMMRNLQEDRKNFVTAIQTIVDVISKKLPQATNQSSPPSVTQMLNCESKYAGIYFVHN
jgi:hypothetical protein